MDKNVLCKYVHAGEEGEGEEGGCKRVEEKLEEKVEHKLAHARTS